MNESKAKTKIIVRALLTAKEFQGSSINDSFIVDLTDYIKKCGAKFWIFGHSYRNINKKIGKTSCLCNQVGYVMSNEHKTFSGDKNIDLNEKENKCKVY